MGKIVGIDLGTTNSVVAFMEGTEVKVISSPVGMRTTPSIVGFTEDGQRLVGMPAKNQLALNPENTVYSIKRFMGRRRSEVDGEAKIVPYKVKAGASGSAEVDIRGKSFSPP